MTEETLPPTNPQPQAPKRRIWSRVLLVASLGLNILIIGVVIGSIASRGGGADRDNSPRLRDVGLGPLERILNRDERQNLRNELAGRAPELRQNRQQLRQDIRAILQALTADPFVPEDLADALAGQQRTIAERQRIGHSAFVSRIASATPEQRREMAARIERALRRGERARQQGN